MTASTSLQAPRLVSPASSLASQPSKLRRFLASLTPQEKAALEFQWRGWWARPSQLAPVGAWVVWLLCSGRGFGKSRTGAEWIREQVGPRNVRSNLRIALVARTAADVRDVIVEGESGILKISPPWNRPKYEPSKRRLTWPNGAIATTFSADKPDQMRGPQYHVAWCDEVAAWRYEDAWHQLRFGNRLPDVVPRIVVTTTPRPIPLIRELIGDSTTAITRGSTFENAGNLAPEWIRAIRRKYEGTRLGRQELFAEILDDTPGALWKRSKLDALRLLAVPRPLGRIVIAVDPAVTSGEDSDETGIVVVALDHAGNGVVLEDLSGRMTPDEWGRVVVGAYRRWEADLIVAEVNNGGDLVEKVVRTVRMKVNGREENVGSVVNFKAVRAARGKWTRAEPISALYEQDRVSHVGVLAELEDQMCTYVPGVAKKSPDRMDALVWGLTELMLGDSSVDADEFDRFAKGFPKGRFDSGAGADGWDD